MPILDIHIVISESEILPDDLATTLATALGNLLGAGPGRVWLRLHPLAARHYAENATPINPDQLPVFVTVLHATLPGSEVLAVQAQAIAHVVAQCVGRTHEWVHIEYAPAGAGRIAFGGKLVQS